MPALPRSRLIPALGFGLLTAVLTLVFLQRAVRPEPAAERLVLVAARDVPANSLLTEEMLTVAPWPATAPLPGALEQAGAAAGRRTLAPLVVGSPVLEHQLAPAGESGPGGSIPPGMRLITIPTNPEASFGYRLQPGDRVDLLRIWRGETAVEASLVLQGVEVYAVGEEGPPGRLDRPQTVTLLVTPDQALAVAALQSLQELRLLLRPTGEEPAAAPPPIRYER